MEERELIEKIDREKEKLLCLITPAIKEFIKETSTIPSINIETGSTKTKCGLWTYDPVIIVKAIL